MRHDDAHLGFFAVGLGQTDEIQWFEPSFRYDRAIGLFHDTNGESCCVCSTIVVVGAHHFVDSAGVVFVDGHVGVGGVASLDVVFQEFAEDGTGDGGVFPLFCQFHHGGTFAFTDNLHVDAIVVESDKLVA